MSWLGLEGMFFVFLIESLSVENTLCYVCGKKICTPSITDGTPKNSIRDCEIIPLKAFQIWILVAMEVVNILNGTDDEINGASGELLEKLESYIGIGIVSIAVLGWIGNFLCYKTVDFLPEPSNGTVLLKYLAVWASIYLFCQSSFAIDLQNFTRFSTRHNVRLQFIQTFQNENLPDAIFWLIYYYKTNPEFIQSRKGIYAIDIWGFFTFFKATFLLKCFF